MRERWKCSKKIKGKSEEGHERRKTKGESKKRTGKNG